MTKELEVKSQVIKCALRNFCSIMNLRNALSTLQSDPNLVQNIIWELSNHLRLVITDCVSKDCVAGHTTDDGWAGFRDFPNSQSFCKPLY